MRSRATVSLRPATADDVDLVYAWANDPASRAASFHSGQIEYADHVAWFEAQLTRPDRNVFIAEHLGRPVAVVRLDRASEREDRCVISLNVAPEARGQGLARPAFEAATREAARLGFATIHALVRPDNQAIVRPLLRAGYVELEPTRAGEHAARLFARRAAAD
jgi:RimJ/RimL family protein N-acetyltransferase